MVSEILSHIFWGHDLDHLWSSDVIGHVMIRYTESGLP